MAAGKFAEAVRIYRELNQALPNNPGLVMNLGLALNYSGRKREAAVEFEKAVKLDPRNMTALLFLGTTYLDLGEAAKALGPLEKVAKTQPDNLDAEEALAEARLALNQFKASAEEFQNLSGS